MEMSVAVVGLAGEFEVGFAEVGALREKTCAALEKTGIQVLDTGVTMYDRATMEQARERLAGQDYDALLVSVGTWSEDIHLLDLMAVVERPVLLHAYPAFDTGSLCGIQQIGAVFRDIGFSDFHYIYGEAGSEPCTSQLRDILKVCALVRDMKRARFGTIGGRAAGMTEIACDEFEIKRRTGARIVEISEPELREAYERIDPRRVLEEEERILPEFPRVTSDPQAVRDSLRWYLALRELLVKYDLRGLSVGCYTRYMGKVCLGFSLLSREGYVFGCEGDVNSTIMMYILRQLTGESVNNTDLLYPDEKANTILFAHCGSTDPAMAATREEICLAPVRLADEGVCVTFTCKSGVVTLADMVGHGGTLRISVMRGESVGCTMEFPGSPMKVRFSRPVLDICRDVAERGMGHHWMAAYGDVSHLLREYCKKTGIDYLAACEL